MSAAEILQPLRSRPFRILWTGQALSNIGNYILPVAIPLLALKRGDGAFGVGLFLGCLQVGYLITLPIAGVLGDRFDRRNVMLAADTIRMVAVFGLAVLPHDLSLMVLAPFLILIGFGEGLFNPAYSASLPLLVEEPMLQRANSLVSISVEGATLLGPGLAGVVVITSSIETLLLINAATFLASLVSLAMLGRIPRAESGTEEPSGAWASFRDGLRLVWSTRWLRGVIGMDAGLILLAYSSLVVLLPVLAVEELGGAKALSMLLVAEGVGALVGGLLAGALRWRHRDALSLVLLLPVSLFLVLLALHAPLPLLLLVNAVVGAGQAVFGVVWITSVQKRVSGDYLARVTSVDWFLSTALLPLGMFVAGPAAAWLGVESVFVIGAVAAGLLIAGALLQPAVRNFGALDLAPSESPQLDNNKSET